MKKLYKTPYTTVVELNLHEKITWGEGANKSNPWDHGGGKETDGLDDVDFIEEDSWNYDLWGDE